LPKTTTHRSINFYCEKQLSTRLATTFLPGQTLIFVQNTNFLVNV